MRRLWIRIGLGVVVLLILVLGVLPLFVNADSFRPALEAKLTQSLNRKVALGHLSFSLLGRSIKANDIAIADDPAFSSQPFLKARELEVGVKVLPFLFGRRLHVTRLTIDSPSIQLIQTKKGAWNFSSIGEAQAAPSSSQTATSQLGLTVEELKIKDGSASVSTLPATGQPFVYSGINLDVRDLSPDASFPFDLKAALPAQGKLELKGQAGPLDANDAADTPFNASLTVSHFDPVAAGAIERNANISMLVDVQAQTASDGKILTGKGKIQAQRLHLAATGAPAKKTVEIDYDLSFALATRAGTLNDLALHAGQAVAHLNGGFAATENGSTLDLRLSAPNLPIDQLEELLPAAGVTLPQGSRLEGGTLTANLAVKGPAASPAIAGPVEVSNTRLAGFDIGSRIQGINPFGGKGGGTSIQTLKATVNNAAGTTRFTGIYANLPQVGSATGEGSVTASEQLDFNLLASFDPASGIGAVAGKAVKTLGSFARRFVQSKTNGAIPVTVSGTASNPSIHANLGAIF